MVRIYLIVLLSMLSENSSGTSSNSKCQVKLDVTACIAPEPANTTAQECNKAKVCQKQFNISYVKIEPYSSMIVTDLLRTCCGPCVEAKDVNSLKKVSQLSDVVMAESHFVFPVLGRPDTKRMYGYHFIPLIETPNVYYITPKTDNVLSELIVSCLDMWPLMIICVLMVMISGFLCWLTETWGNKDEFPRSFLRGWFEGIWWSFISMTTVGYGDKCPKSAAARVFSVIWIVIGITTFSLVTAMLTSEISAANSLPPPKMENENVGVVRHRIYESILIATQGGILVDVDPLNITEGINMLIGKLKKKEIDGFVLDRYTLMLFYSFFADDPRGDVEYLRKRSVLTEVIHTEQFLYGILVKRDDDYHFLKDFMTSNRDVINTCNSLFLNELGRTVRVQQNKVSLFSTEGKMFKPTFILCSSVVVVIFAAGLLVEYHKKKKTLNPKGDGKAFI